MHSTFKALELAGPFGTTVKGSKKPTTYIGCNHLGHYRVAWTVNMVGAHLGEAGEIYLVDPQHTLPSWWAPKLPNLLAGPLLDKFTWCTFTRQIYLVVGFY